MDLIPVLIPSRNRASQLHLLLESIQANCPNLFDIHILLKTDNAEYLKGYGILVERNIYPNLTIIDERDCCSQFYQCLNSWRDRYFGLFCDDCIFYRPINIGYNDVDNWLKQDLWAVNLRLGLNTTRHGYFPRDEWMQPISKYEECDNYEFITYNYMDYSYLLNYGYYFHWDGIVYRTQDILNILQGFQFNNLREVEFYMLNHRNKSTSNNFVIPKNSCVVCMQWNCVHNKVGYHGGLVKVHQKDLNDKYLNGEIIDLDKMDFSCINSCHYELMPCFRKY